MKTLFLAGLAAFLCCLSVQARTLDHWQFETSAEGWVSPQGISGLRPGKCDLSRQQAQEGKASLACLYTVTPQHIFGMGRPFSVATKETVIFDFWMKSLRTPQWVLSLEEQDGSAYYYVIDLPRTGQWQHISISSQNFKLGKDELDENHRLDLDQVEMLILFEISGLSALEESKTAVLLDDFKIMTEW